MKKPNSIQFVLSAKKIISVNALYGAKLTYSGARPIATLYKKAEAKKMEKYIQEQEKHDIAMDKLSVKEYEDPFKG